jgi:uncharacterized membrane protein
MEVLGLVSLWEGNRNLAIVGLLYKCRQGLQQQGRACLGSQMNGYEGGELILRYLVIRDDRCQSRKGFM